MSLVHNIVRSQYKIRYTRVLCSLLVLSMVVELGAVEFYGSKIQTTYRSIGQYIKLCCDGPSKLVLGCLSHRSACSILYVGRTVADDG